MADAGKYNKNQELYQTLVDKMYEDYKDGVCLPPEYAMFFEKDLLRLLIRLARYKFVARQITKSDSILEVGSGSGVGTIFLGQHAKEAVGIDIKSTEVEEANSVNRRENVRFICADFFNHEFESKFDAIVSLDVIEHLGEENTDVFLAKIAKTLKENGYCIIGTPSLYSWEHQSDLSKASHEKCYDLPELRELVEKYFGRTLVFSMNDEMVHTGYYKMAWYYYVLAFYPKDIA